MRKPGRIVSLLLATVMMFVFAVASVAADDETDLKDLKKVISITECK